MGQGEPLANYENVKTALNLILKYTELGPTNITVSTVGLLPVLDQILTDDTWPNVRLAISLHAADETKRRSLMPSTAPDFFAKLADW
ncbi:23S rRNA (adenine(2503)-C(2))-methyltransferase RlmN, partial [Patescibacteria group bacterium]|nr:23S rRNA (adenine(2503)-C(2))-methyltransferase RlmN [Patescibacteria group bacterium]